jgi:RNA polymerase sigma-70 factor, ECF subfamily
VDHVQQTDESLVELIAQRDPDALAALYDRHAPAIYNLVMRIVREAALADELLQDTFWQVWRKAGDFEGTGSAAAWLHRIARNKSLDQLRRQKARPQLVSHDESADGHPPLPAGVAQPASVEQLSEQAWERRQVRQALSKLPREQRICLELAYFEGLSQRQIAEHLDAPVGTVKTRVRLGMDKLAGLLRAVGYLTEDDRP